MPGPAKVDQAMRAIRFNEVDPGWLRIVGRDNVMVDAGRLHVMMLPVLTRKELVARIKKNYYSAGLPSVPKAIYAKLGTEVANVSERSVRRIVESFETYQLTKRVLQPSDNRGHRVWQSPGVIQADTTFLDKNWDRKVAILVMHDVWSGYTGAYVVDSENAVIANRALRKFGRELMSDFGVRPKLYMTDLGTEFANVRRGVAALYGAPHLQSPTGKPIHEIEAKNAMLKRRIEIQRVAHKLDDAGALSGFLGAILTDINNSPRDWRAGYTPVQLLRMGPRLRAEVNATTKGKRRYKYGKQWGFDKKVLRVGDHVRRILWTSKEVANRPMGKKGYMQKWSREIYRVLKKITQKNNVPKFRIDDGIQRLYFRTELQKVDPDKVDTGVPAQTRPSGWDDPERIVTGTRVDDSSWGRSDEAYVPPAAIQGDPAPRLRRSTRGVARVDYRPPDYSEYGF